MFLFLSKSVSHAAVLVNNCTKSIPKFCESPTAFCLNEPVLCLTENIWVTYQGMT